MLRKTTFALAALMILALSAGLADRVVAGTAIEYGLIWDW
jgi:hypothetical protein